MDPWSLFRSLNMDLRLVTGCISSFCLLMSPLPAILSFFTKKVEEFHPFNYLAGSLCCVWTLFESQEPHPIWTISFIGYLLYAVYHLSFYVSAAKKRRERMILAAVLYSVAPVSFLLLDMTPPDMIITKVAAVNLIVLNIVFCCSEILMKTRTEKIFFPFWIILAAIYIGGDSVFRRYNSMLVCHVYGAVFLAFHLFLHYSAKVE